MDRPNPLISESGYSTVALGSGVTWTAVFAGAVAAVAVSLSLLVLGSSLGLSTISPWSNAETIASVTAKTAIWIIIMQWLASGLGGYLAGRLRTKWSGLHGDEVFFRDTSHGFLAWSVATILTASVLASAVTSVISGGAQATAIVAAGAAGGASKSATTSETDPNAYFIDSLFRSSTVNTNVPAPDANAEATRILVKGLKDGAVPDADRAYLAQVVSARAGISQADATKRVDDTINQMTAAKEKAKETLETARKNAMHASVFLFLSLLVGAFIASVAGVIGGRHRDEV